MKLIPRLRLKFSNPEEYKNFKYLKRLVNLPHPAFDIIKEDFYSFKHSGNAGDIMYALPAMIALAKGKPIHFYLQINQPGIYGKNPHPLGGLMLTQKMVDMLKPLLMNQNGIEKVEVYNGEPIDYDLDIFRDFPIWLSRGNISRWYFLVFPVTYPLHLPWLKVTPDSSVKDHIIIARSQRYRAPGIDYSFLSRYKKILFVGVQVEYEEMKQMIPGIEYRQVDNFLQLAQLIMGCKLFIGNQSFPFSIAEGLKARRLMELYFQAPNVSVAGENGYDFCFQPQFEFLAKKLTEEN
ncbi:MAG TPA: hypothetical protein VK484_11290 [Ferruginibacter sp.]|nr:hypothetical protein [Ferruginibacter sp.]